MGLTFIGHQKIWDQLCSEVEFSRLPAAILFYGPHGIGKKLVARELAGLLFCERRGAPAVEAAISLFGPEESAGNSVSSRLPCGHCPSCLRLADNHHPDFFLLAPDEKGSIKIERIRDMKQRLKHAPLEAPAKVVLIDDANLLTEGASNSLLKMLEDPPPSTHFILLSPSLFPILPTIRSRCRKLFFSPPPPLEMASHMAKVWECPPERAELLLSRAGGSPGLASFFLEEDVEETLVQLERLLEGTPNFETVAQVAKKVSGLGGDMDLSLLVEVLACRYYEKHGVNLDGAGFKKLDRLWMARRDLKGYINPTLVFESLF